MIISEKLQSAFIATLIGLTIPITILNLLGGVISGIWLAILGEWGEIGRGLLFLVISGFAISFALIPGLLFAAPAVMAIKKGKKFLGIFFGSLSVFYTVALITVWCLWVMWLFVSSASESSLIPLLIWSYGVALGPWMWLAQKDQQVGENEFSIMTTFFAQISYILAMIMFFIGAALGTIAITFGVIMIIGAILQISVVFAAERQQEYKTFNQVISDEEDIVDESKYPKPKKELCDTQEPAIFYCGKCGNKLKNDSKFCPQCGAKVK